VGLVVVEVGAIGFCPLLDRDFCFFFSSFLLFLLFFSMFAPLLCYVASRLPLQKQSAICNL